MNVSFPQSSIRADAEVTACPSCHGGKLTPLYEVRNIPAQSCVVLDSYEQAINYPRRDLKLSFCEDCGFIFNRVFDRKIVDYFLKTEESQHFSGTFNRFAKELAADIAGKCDISGKTIVEIGCGKGDFLAELCAHAECKGIGIDPGFYEERLKSDSDERKLRFIREYFDAQRHDFDPDVIMCRHTLEHIPDVAAFMKQIRTSIKGDKKVTVFFETPDVKRVLAEGAFWDIYYEHCSYFTEGTHARLFRQEGFEVTDSALGYDDQYILQYAIPAGRHDAARLREDEHQELTGLAKAFPDKVRGVQNRWRDLVLSHHDAGRRVVLWGGGSKCVSFITTLGLDSEIDFVVDINPYKQSKYLVGTGHLVAEPGALKERPADLIIVMNPIYVNEIRKTLADLGLSPEVVAL